MVLSSQFVDGPSQFAGGALQRRAPVEVLGALLHAVPGVREFFGVLAAHRFVLRGLLCFGVLLGGFGVRLRVALVELRVARRVGRVELRVARRVGRRGIAVRLGLVGPARRSAARERWPPQPRRGRRAHEGESCRAHALETLFVVLSKLRLGRAVTALGEVTATCCSASRPFATVLC